VPLRRHSLAGANDWVPNVVVRYLTQDDGIQSAKATDLFELGLTEEEPGFVSVEMHPMIS
jgi:hypothetical protein